MSEPNTVVVLGGLGFVGSRVCHALVKQGYNVRIFDRPGVSRFRLAGIEERLTFTEGNYSDPDSVLAALDDAEIAINLVHTTVPAISMLDPMADVMDNVVASIGWMRRLKETRIRKLIYFSSGGTVYGSATNPGLISEDSACEPICAYGISKLAIEKYTLMFCYQANICPLILRPGNIYGPNPQFDRPQGLVGVLIAKALRNESIEVVGDGCAVRDYIFVDDVASAVTLLLSYHGNEHLFNIGTGVGHSINDMIAILKRFIPIPDPQYVPARSFDVESNILDSSRLKRETGWQAVIPLNAGLLEVIRSAGRAI